MVQDPGVAMRSSATGRFRVRCPLRCWPADLRSPCFFSGGSMQPTSRGRNESVAGESPTPTPRWFAPACSPPDQSISEGNLDQWPGSDHCPLAPSPFPTTTLAVDLTGGPGLRRVVHPNGLGLQSITVNSLPPAWFNLVWLPITVAAKFEALLPFDEAPGAAWVRPTCGLWPSRPGKKSPRSFWRPGRFCASCLPGRKRWRAAGTSPALNGASCIPQPPLRHDPGLRQSIRTAGGCRHRRGWPLCLGPSLSFTP